jgi:hypothetical protein
MNSAAYLTFNYDRDALPDNIKRSRKLEKR